MFRLSKLTDYAVVVLIRLAAVDGVQTSPGVALATGVPEPTVAKVLKALAASGLVASQRGARGGYRLMRPLAGIAVADVIAAIDGPIAMTACVEGSGGRAKLVLCPVRGRWDAVNDAVRDALSAISLADMATPTRPRRCRALPLPLRRIGRPSWQPSPKPSTPSSRSPSPATSGALKPTSRWMSPRRA